MEWFVFLKCYFGIMILYYAIIIAYDYFFGNKKIQIPEDEVIAYDIKNLLDEENHAQHIEPEETPLSSSTEAPEQETVPISNEESVEEKAVAFSQPPQGQGIPLDDFIRKARQMSKEIEFH